MGEDQKNDGFMAKHHQELATRNSKVAVTVALESKQTVDQKLQALEFVLGSLTQQVADLQQKYNLLLSARFNPGPTSR